MNPRLRVEVGMQVDIEYEVPPREKQSALWLGRGALCDIEINDPQLSRRHCRFTFEDGRLIVEDLDSRNGTVVNGERIFSPVELHHNDEVTVGGNVLQVVWPTTTHHTRVDQCKLGTPAEIEQARRELDELAGTQFAGYRVEKMIQDGPLCGVFRGRDAHREVPVALKIMKRLDRISSADRSRFVCGARAAGGLKHRNFAHVVKGGKMGGFFFVATEFASGSNVEEMVEERQGPMDTRLAIAIARQVLEGLEAAHEQNLVHSGIFADNIIVGDRLRVKIVDYDMMRPVTKPEQTADKQTGRMLLYQCHVDRAFAAPEQVAYPAVADPKSDVFGTGAVLYYMLCGRAPYDQTLPGDRLSSAFDRTFDPPRALNPAVPDAVASVVTQAMSEYSRFNSAQEMRAALDEAGRISNI